ncbi:MAG TPA: cellulose biosynthesis cyclic di-GMP-binding regulatory protein BcsB [Gallionellaceae bacterium]|nr:cellulose biosynthesis cyclic di-GMP-binding regulatory protein BcsB [Gallionellaceae bacterium]
MINIFRRIIEFSILIAGMLLAQVAAQADTVKLPLAKFTSSPSLEMRCLSGSQSLSIPVPDRWNVTKAVLNLRYTTSNNLLPDISQMVVRVNGEVVNQMKLDNPAPGVFKQVEIPIDLLRPGYNTFTFQVAQHYQRSQCEQPCAPDLWTAISVVDSSLQMDYELRPIPLQLGEAAAWAFDPRQFPSVSVNLVTDVSTAQSVTMAAMAASGIARRLDYRKVTFSHSDDIKQGVDNVLIGTSDFVNGVLARYGLSLEGGEGGLIKVFYMPKKDGGKDGLHALIVVTGKGAAELKIAAETFANMSLPYPGTSEMRTLGFSMPDISMYSGRQELVPDKAYDFKTLGMPSASFLGFNGTATAKGFSNPAADISFRLPPDFLIKQNQYARVNLNFSYGSGLRQDSALSISLNGRQIRDIHLDNVDGNYLANYRIDIPTYMFKPGTNTISFRPYLNTARQVCDASNTDGLFVTIYGNSTLTFPPMPHFVQMPKTELFVLNGFPFTRWPDGYDTLIYLPQHDAASIDTALDLIGMITQKNGFPLFGTQVVFSDPKGWNGEMLVVGEASAIPKSIMARAPFQPDGMANIPYPVSRGWDTETAIAISKQQGGLGEGTGLLMEFESAYKKGRSVVVATAQTGKDLSTLGDALLSPAIQSRIKGDVSLVRLDTPDYDVVSMNVGKKYYTGDKGNMSAIGAFFNANPYALYVAIAAGLLGLSWLGFWLARRHRAKRMGQA